MLRRFIRNNFGFSASETNGFLILLPLIVICIFSEPIYRWWFIEHGHRAESSTKKLDSLIAKLEWPATDSVIIKKTRTFSFDPNTVSEEEMLGAGISQKVAQRIVRYRAKGGKFRSRKDFAKIYGMDSVTIQRLGASLIFPTPIIPKKPPAQASLKSKFPPKKERVKFDLNLSDSVALMSLYGIGSKLSGRILKYRERLGGFISMDQLNEIYGLDSVVVNKLKAASFIDGQFVPRQVNVNLGDQKELSKIPYLKYAMAKAIVAWRFQHGNFKSIDELTQIVVIDALTFEKIKPYLTVNE